MQITLKLVTKADLNHQSLKKLKDWRLKNRFAYVGKYKITEASIKKWLKKYVLESDDRILYWVVVDGKYIGHIGLTNIKLNSAELCDVSRGVDGYPGAMHEAMQLLIGPYKKISLRVLADNHHAITFYERNGFHLVGKSGPYLKYFITQNFK